MLVLWNGKYEEHEIPNCSESHLRYMAKQHEQWVGHVVGDFTCLKVEYDWGRRDQRWTIQCNRCGAISYQYHVADWRRGKGRSLLCPCRKFEKQAAEEKAREEAKQMRMANEEKIFQTKKDFIGKSFGNFEIVNINTRCNCIVKCTICGKTKATKYYLTDVIAEAIPPCDHKPNTASKFDDPKWIGQRNGHLTAIGREGGLFIVKCDCGQETTARGVDLFTRKAKKSCGLVGCTCSTNEHIASVQRRKQGFDYEAEVEAMLKSKGYNASATKQNGDYGVDIIITETDGSRIAVQCKHESDIVGVKAIQEVYAGGRFYDCTKFAVVCKSCFSNNAIIMARRLGVYLCDGEFDFPKDMDKYTENLLPIYHEYHSEDKYYELNGEKRTLADWCAIYEKAQSFVEKRMKEGVSLETALKMKVPQPKNIYTLGDLTGTLEDFGRFFGIIPQTLYYRINTMGLTLEEAIYRSIDKQ